MPYTNSIPYETQLKSRPLTRQLGFLFMVATTKKKLDLILSNLVYGYQVYFLIIDF